MVVEELEIERVEGSVTCDDDVVDDDDCEELELERSCSTCRSRPAPPGDHGSSRHWLVR
jgi:hypothetical protein